MNHPQKAVLLLGALLAAGMGARAQTTAPDAPYLEPCKADVARFCRGIDPRSDEMIGCLKERREEVSDTCKARLAQMRVRPAPAPAGDKPIQTGK